MICVRTTACAYFCGASWNQPLVMRRTSQGLHDNSDHAQRADDEDEAVATRLGQVAAFLAALVLQVFDEGRRPPTARPRRTDRA